MSNLTRIAPAILLASSSLIGCDQAPTEGVSLSQLNQQPPQAAHPPGAGSAARPAAGTATAGGGAVGAGPVIETMNSGGYTYVHVDTGTGKVWAAAPQTQVAVGEQVTIPAGMAMQDFHSKTLNRTFELVYFVSTLGRGQGAGAAAPGMPAGHPPTGTAPGQP